MHWAFHEAIRTSSKVVLEDSEAHHVLNVLRMKSGDRLTLFDGQGHSAAAQITRVTRRDAECEIVERHPAEQKLSSLRVAASPPKADRLRWLVEKLTELGVEEYIPLRTERTVVTPGETRMEKLRATVIAACKQCHRASLMNVRELATLEVLLQLDAGPFLLAHPGATTDWQTLGSELPKGATLLIGPEGGFTQSEVELVTSHGARCVSWPGTILRTETAAIAFASAFISRVSI